jgi:hypothetical protein
MTSELDDLFLARLKIAANVRGSSPPVTMSG